MGLVKELGIEPGVTAIIGSGGKTTLMEQLARELAATTGSRSDQEPRMPNSDGSDNAAGTAREFQASASLCTVALATTTRVLPPLDFPLLANLSAAEVAACLPTVGIAYVGSVRETKGVRKLGAPLWGGTPDTDALLDRKAPANTSTSINESREDVVASIETLAHLATYTLVEADGSHHLPLKAHASWEPVVPADARTILVVGAFGFGRPVEKVVHRSELFCERTGCSPADLATPELVAREICSEAQQGLISFDTVLVTGRNSGGEASIRAFERALRSNGISAPMHVA